MQIITKIKTLLGRGYSEASALLEGLKVYFDKNSVIRFLKIVIVL
jgi:hypothetical protein